MTNEPLSDDRDSKSQHRVFRYSINILSYHYNGYSRPFEIKNWWGYILPSLWFSLVTITLGFWGWGPLALFRKLSHIRHATEALHVNFTGGEDVTKIVEDFAYSDKTNYVWNNLTNATKLVCSQEAVQIVTEIQEEYTVSGKQSFSDENIDFINHSLGKLNYVRIGRMEMDDIFEAMKLYDRYLEENTKV
ncbi:MAG TPA: hypothetical protein VGO45_06355 [Bacteroidia bacterium]|jgi:hypothetical protein|nr:hypothetical protein [Bacteroidia bacterium]